ncbi:MAG: DUF350 domain-containing protein [Elusimicrobia bacterium]|nr:DUF350 domain-containing protein [Elusimicrobiota bacterium]
MSSFVTRLLISVFELAASVIIAVFVIFVSYRIFIRANTDFDEEEEIKKGNVAVGILLAAIMVASAMIIQKGLYPIMSMIRIYLTSPVNQTFTQWQVPVFALAHFMMVFGLAVGTISFSLRLYGRLTRHVQEGKELQKGNPAVGMVLGAVVIIVAMYVGDGIGSLAKALVPQPSIGRIQILK